MNHRHLNQGLTRLRQDLVVLAQPTVSPQPAEGPLTHPPLRQALEPLLLVAPLDHLQLPTALAPRPVDQPLLLIDPIDPDHLQPRAAILAPRHRRLGPAVILHTRP